MVNTTSFNNLALSINPSADLVLLSRTRMRIFAKSAPRRYLHNKLQTSAFIAQICFFDRQHDHCHFLIIT